MEVKSKRENDNLAYAEKVLLNCFSRDTDYAMDKLYQDPEAVALLALARRFSKEDKVYSAVSKHPSE